MTLVNSLNNKVLATTLTPSQIVKSDGESPAESALKLINTSLYPSLNSKAKVQFNQISTSIATYQTHWNKDAMLGTQQASVNLHVFGMLRNYQTSEGLVKLIIDTKLYLPKFVSHYMQQIEYFARLNSFDVVDMLNRTFDKAFVETSTLKIANLSDTFDTCLFGKQYIDIYQVLRGDEDVAPSISFTEKESAYFNSPLGAAMIGFKEILKLQPTYVQTIENAYTVLCSEVNSRKNQQVSVENLYIVRAVNGSTCFIQATSITNALVIVGWMHPNKAVKLNPSDIQRTINSHFDMALHMYKIGCLTNILGQQIDTSLPMSKDYSSFLLEQFMKGNNVEDVGHAIVAMFVKWVELCQELQEVYQNYSS